MQKIQKGKTDWTGQHCPVCLLLFVSFALFYAIMYNDYQLDQLSTLFHMGSLCRDKPLRARLERATGISCTERLVVMISHMDRCSTSQTTDLKKHEWGDKASKPAASQTEATSSPKRCETCFYQPPPCTKSQQSSPTSPSAA